MKRIWCFCLLVLVAVALGTMEGGPAVKGQANRRGNAQVIERPGEAATLGLLNQAEARQLYEGKLRVPVIGAGFVPNEQGVPQGLELEPLMPASVKGRVLILYDAVTDGSSQKFGLAYAIMLTNLLGHFNASVNLLPVDRYTRGTVELYQATFYLGSHYNSPVPDAFMRDARRTSRTVVWFKNNLWQFAWNQAYDFSGRYGFNFAQLKGFDTPPSPENPQPGFFDTVTYKTLPFVKFYHYDAASNVAYADPDLGVTQIIDPQKARALLTVTNSRTGEIAPYLTRSGRFWYFADLPFSYIGARDRYVIFCDVLHDILNQAHTTNHRALLRLEDVNAKVEPKTFRHLTDYLSNSRIPFSIALIPTYRNPFGMYNNGVPETIELAQAANLLQVAKYARQRGAGIVMHGHTHQFDAMRNPTGMSGEDWEFWDALNNRPVSGDSQEMMLRRIDLGLSALRAQELSPFAWETPHYQGSPLSYRAVKQRLAVKYERGTYYTADRPNLTGGDYAMSQFFPYLIQEDVYGHRVLPENLGNVAYTNSANPQALNGRLLAAACGHRTSLSQADSLRRLRNARVAFASNHFALYENARYAWVVRDGFASFFFHPYLLRPETGVPAMADLQELVNGISQLGYRWTAASTLVQGN